MSPPRATVAPGFPLVSRLVRPTSPKLHEVISRSESNDDMQHAAAASWAAGSSDDVPGTAAARPKQQGQQGSYGSGRDSAGSKERHAHFVRR
jgi:hypothetical protein